MIDDGQPSTDSLGEKKEGKRIEKERGSSDSLSKFVLVYQQSARSQCRLLPRSFNEHEDPGESDDDHSSSGTEDGSFKKTRRRNATRHRSASVLPRTEEG